MPIMIHNREYITVAERLVMAHKEGLVSIDTQVLYQEPVVVRAIVTTNKGTFTGISAANPDKTLEKQSPYEIAETSAVGRALGFAGYGAVEGIASADEMIKSSSEVTPEVVNEVFGDTSDEAPHGVQTCRSCGSRDLTVKISGPTSKKPGSKYTKCNQCNAFVGYL